MIRQVGLGQSSGDSPDTPTYAPVSEVDSAPAEGATVSTPTTINDIVVRLNPSTQRDSVTVVLPNPAAWRIRQIVFIHSTQGISALTVTAAAGVTVNNFTADIQPGDCLAYFRISSTIWARIQ